MSFKKIMAVMLAAVAACGISASALTLDVAETTDEFNNEVYEAKLASEEVKSGTWGGIDWTLDAEGTLTIAPTAGEPVHDKNAPTKRMYEVGEWREAVVYNSKGSASAIGGYPYDVKAVKKLIIKEGVTTIGSFTVQFPNLTGEVVIPSTVTYIGQEAFHKTPITSLVFAEGGTAPLCIANGAFKKILVEEVILPEGREYIHIHHWAFGGCPNLKNAYIPSCITKTWGGEHVDYFDNFNSQSNVTWVNYSCLFSGDAALETVTFGSEEARDLFFSHDNGVISYSNGSYNGDYIVGAVGLTAYGDNAVEEMTEAVAEGGEILLYRPCSADVTTSGELKITYKGKDAAYTGTITLTSKDASVEVTVPENKVFNGTVTSEVLGVRVEEDVVDGKTVINYVQCNALLTHDNVSTAYDFDEALEEAVAGDTITLLDDVVYNIDTTSVNSGVIMATTSDIIIDLNGKTLSPADPTIPTFVSGEDYVLMNGTITGDVVVNGGNVAIKDVVIEGNLETTAGAVEFTSGAVTGEVAVETGATLEISGGTFADDITGYAAPDYEVVRNSDGYTVAEKKLQADSISVEYKDVTAADVEGKKVYQVIVKANDDDFINELASVDLTFVYTSVPVNGGKIDFTVASAKDFTMSREGNTNRYMFNYNGTTAYEGTANAIPVATIEVNGYGAYTISTAEVETNVVNATTVYDNLVDSYTVAGATDNDVTTGALEINKDTVADDGLVGEVTNGEIKIPTRLLTINVAFPNAVLDNEIAYQDMKVEITGNIEGVQQTITYNLGEDEIKMVDGKYVVKDDRLVLNETYNVVVSGAGYRTARYSVTMTDKKELNFWNNVKDNAVEVEKDKASSAVTKNFLAGDIVGDNQINIYDLSAVVSYFATNAKSDYAKYVKYDLNRDGTIDSKDVAYVLVSWGA